MEVQVFNYRMNGQLMKTVAVRSKTPPSETASRLVSLLRKMNVVSRIQFNHVLNGATEGAVNLFGQPFSGDAND